MNNDDPFVHDEGVPGHDRSQRIAYLVAGYLEESLSGDEVHELNRWLNENESNKRIFADLTDLKKLERQLAFTDKLNRTAAWDRIRTNVEKNTSRRFELRKYIAAACALLVLGFAVTLILINKHSKTEKPSVLIPAPGLTNPGDIDPGESRATLQLGSGRIITLNDSATQSIQIGITNADGQLQYTNIEAVVDTGWHILTTPAGGEYLVVLPDRTKVWLNAASSLRYPASFTGSQRKVELKGEGFFKVSSDSRAPFIVDLPGKVAVTVFGTSFNINAYQDEPVIKTTLLEGKVKMAAAGNTHEMIMEPGQQVAVSPGGKMKKILLNDPDDEIAWQKGLFEFKNQPIDIVMRAVARWYNAEIIYQSRPTSQFNASISRNLPVSKLLSYLETTKRVRFEVKNNKIIVKK